MASFLQRFGTLPRSLEQGTLRAGHTLRARRAGAAIRAGGLQGPAGALTAQRKATGVSSFGSSSRTGRNLSHTSPLLCSAANQGSPRGPVLNSPRSPRTPSCGLCLGCPLGRTAPMGLQLSSPRSPVPGNSVACAPQTFVSKQSVPSFP